MNKTAQSVLKLAMVGSILATAGYFMHGKPAAVAPAVDTSDVNDAWIASTFDAAKAREAIARSNATAALKLACRVLRGDDYAMNADYSCTRLVDCTSCVTRKGGKRFAIIHDNGPVAVKHVKPDYSLMMANDKIIFRNAMASRAATEAGREAYDASMKNTRNIEQGGTK